MGNGSSEWMGGCGVKVLVLMMILPIATPGKEIGGDQLDPGLFAHSAPADRYVRLAPQAHPITTCRWRLHICGRPVSDWCRTRRRSVSCKLVRVDES